MIDLRRAARGATLVPAGLAMLANALCIFLTPFGVLGHAIALNRSMTAGDYLGHGAFVLVNVVLLYGGATYVADESRARAIVVIVALWWVATVAAAAGYLFWLDRV